MSKCKICYGDGYVDANAHNFDTEYTDIQACPRCEGSGEQDERFDK